jgi:uncharacterized protein
MLHLEGRGVEKNLTTALEHLELAIQQHDPQAKRQLARLLKDNLSEVVHCYKVAAHHKQPWALLGLGKLYALGIGLTKNYAEAIKHLKEAASLNNPYALCELGKLFVLGYGQEADYEGKTHYEAAQTCFTRALKQGVPEADCELVKMHLCGCGVPQQDIEQGLSFIKAAAENSVPEALLYLGMMYRQGIGVDQNIAIAIEKFQAAAALGSTRAMFNLGQIYQNGEGVVTQDYSTALKYYHRAAVLGNKNALTNLGVMQQKGQGVAKNSTIAVEKYRAAAGLGDHTALFNLGVMYLYGNGVAQDYSTAIDCFRRAAELGYDKAWDALKTMRDQGQGDIGDYETARTYYEEVHKKLPHPDGYRNDYGDDQDSAIFLYYKAQNNDARALYNLGMLHLEGRGVEKNMTTALKHLEQAEQLDDMQAKSQLDKLLNSDDDNTQQQILAAYLEAAKKNKTWALLGLGKLYMNGTALVKQDRMKGWAYLEELVSMKGSSKLNKMDISRIKEANDLLGQIKFRGNHTSIATELSEVALEPVIENVSYLTDADL